MHNEPRGNGARPSRRGLWQEEFVCIYPLILGLCLKSEESFVDS